MGTAARTLATAGPHERALGRWLFDRYPHLVPSPTWVRSLCSTAEGSEGPSLGNARPLMVLEAWFDCWADLAFREPYPSPCCCDDACA